MDLKILKIKGFGFGNYDICKTRSLGSVKEKKKNKVLHLLLKVSKVLWLLLIMIIVSEFFVLKQPLFIHPQSTLHRPLVPFFFFFYKETTKECIDKKKVQ